MSVMAFEMFMAYLFMKCDTNPTNVWNYVNTPCELFGYLLYFLKKFEDLFIHILNVAS